MAAKTMYILFEHAVGYALFRVKEYFQIEQLKAEVESSILDLSRFNSVVKLEAFSEFKDAKQSLDNVKAVAEGVLHADLKEFIQSTLPVSTNNVKVVLGVSDPKLMKAVRDETGINTTNEDPVSEILRGLRLHAPKLMRGLNSLPEDKLQVRLGRNLAISKLQFSDRDDFNVIQSVGCLDDKDKSISTLSSSIRGLYSDHFPELTAVVPDDKMYCLLIQFIGDRKTLTDGKLEGLEEIVVDSSKAKAILCSARSSLGIDISSADLDSILNLAQLLITSINNRETLYEYICTKMQHLAPNLSKLVGEETAARLIVTAGSLRELAKCSTSTVQILGARKAVFRNLKAFGNPSECGLLFNSAFSGKASQKNKSRIARTLAQKCSMAARLDCFSDAPTSEFGAHLQELVEEQLKIYEKKEMREQQNDILLSEAEKSLKAVVSAKEHKSRKIDSAGDDSEGPRGKRPRRESGAPEVNECLVNPEHERAEEIGRKKRQKINEEIKNN